MGRRLPLDILNIQLDWVVGPGFKVALYSGQVVKLLSGTVKLMLKHPVKYEVNRAIKYTVKYILFVIKVFSSNIGYFASNFSILNKEVNK